MLPVFFITLSSVSANPSASPSVNPAVNPSIRAASSIDRDRIGQLIFQNECASQDSCLTSWNAGEEFASLGIGHFIWYPAGAKKTFHESFPDLIAFLQQHGATLPAWLFAMPDQSNPWSTRTAFLAAQSSEKMHALRSLLMRSKALQSAFMQQRLQQTLPLMLHGLGSAASQHVRRQFAYMAASPMGMYALMDYVNFKGEGTHPEERYHGQGWGMLQVLQRMHVHHSGIAAIKAFAQAADELLTQRVALAPPNRDEQRWLPGWRKRLTTYVREAEARLQSR